ncbi:hypothetical protein E1288_40580 [Saccharopolyspora elongata]|uniref:Uncharacterized protein n=1 Tax=Saccharopolyspora elongata TaxID=2530387 RepID=A0A4R4Y087_9PSEU|nr:hypothetical protein E1288_40580 [Saccharopolyspora elongata]
MSDTEIALRGAERSLLLSAAEIVRLRYVHRGGDASLSQTAAGELANFFGAIARGHPALDEGDRKEAIALAHRVIDDDHPEHSRMWPTYRRPGRVTRIVPSGK